MNKFSDHYEISEIIFTQTGPGERAVIQMDKLGDLLDSKGGIKDANSTISFVNQMKDACKLPCRFIFLYIIEATTEDVLIDFMKNGGWSVVSHWLKDAKTKDNKALINCLLNVCKILPVSVEQMKENNCAKLIKSISKAENAEQSDLKILARSIVDKWKNAVKSEGSQVDKKKKKHKHRKRSIDETKSDSKPEESSPVSKTIKLSPKEGEVETNKKLKTVKEPKLKLRATGLEQETNLPQKKKGSKDNHVGLPKISTTLPPSKRASMAAKNIQPPEKKARKETGDIQQGKIKLITTPPPMPAQESSLFMDAIMTASSKNAPKKKKVKKTHKSATSPSNTASSPPYSTESGSPPPATADSSDKIEKSDDSPIRDNDYAPKVNKKRVRWAEESELKEFFYFELDETERVNVNKLKDFEEIKREEMMREKQAMLAKKAGFDLDDGLTILHFWNPIQPISPDDLPSFPKSTKSNEIIVQREREEKVLAAIYFNKSAIPPSAHEPDPHPETKCPPPVIIPLNSSNEMRFEHQTHRSSESGMLQTSDGKLQLRPDVSNLLASMANQVQNGGQMQVAKDAIQKLPSHLRSLLEQPQIQGVVVQTVGDDPKKIMELLNDPNKLQQIIGNYQMRQVRGGSNSGGGNCIIGGGGGIGGVGGGGGGGGGGNGNGNMGGGMPRHNHGGNGQFRGPRRVLCKHFMHGTCKFGPSCNFLHPGINGPKV